MQSNMLRVEIYDQTTQKRRIISVPPNCKLSQLRDYLQKEMKLKNFRFVNDVGDKGVEKHTPVETYMKDNIITIATRDQQPKKQSKIIEKQSKRQQVTIRHSIAASKPQQQKKEAITKLPLTTQQIINQKHFKWTKQNIEYCRFKYGIELSQDGYGLDHDYTAIDMEEFTKYDWGNIEWLGLFGCGIDDQSWRMFVDSAGLFEKLKILGLKDNKITTLKQGDLQAFKSLRLVEFGTVSGQNPLTTQSKQYLKKFKEANKHIKVKFRV